VSSRSDDARSYVAPERVRRERRSLVAPEAAQALAGTYSRLGDPTRTIPSKVTVTQAKGCQFISDDIEICRYLAKTYGFGEPH
jgi:hypothetical protein